MVPINQEQWQDSRSQNHVAPEGAYNNIPQADASASDSTQRIRVSQTPYSTENRGAAPRRTAQPSGAQQARRAPQNKRRKKNKTLPLVLMLIAAVLLIGTLIISAIMITRTEDNGLILDNVYAAGVDLGGLTPEQAKKALSQATDSTYTQLDMVVQILDETVTLTPQDTEAKLDVDAVVEAAYNYGRTGTRAERQKARNQALTSQYHIPIVEYLNLNTDYITGVLDQLGQKYISILSQPSATISGDRPSMTMEEYDTSIVYQTLTIFTGTAEYGLNTDELYEQILDAYSINLFQVAAKCTVVTPNPLDVDALFDDYCTKPIDASIDEFYNTTPEIYGYGFDLETVKQQVSAAPYGTTIEVPLTFIRPATTEEDLAGNLFKDILGQAVTALPEDPDWIVNLTTACKELNGLVLKTGDRFSFNEIIGEPTVRKGYKSVPAFVGTAYTDVVGGGISQVASTLYVSAIQADLLILERYYHTYAPSFIDPGLDADIQYGYMDLKFTNNTAQPIRIEAKVEGGQVKIVLWGTNTRDYTVQISYETVRTYRPTTLVQTLDPEQAGEYADGDVLVEGITGYDVITYKTYVYKDSSGKRDEIEIAQSHYEKRNKVVSQLREQVIPEPTETTEPAETTEPTQAQEADD